MRHVVLHPGEDGLWVAECPSLPGCISQRPTRDVALRTILEAIEGYLQVLRDDGIAPPADRVEVLTVAV